MSDEAPHGFLLADWRPAHAAPAVMASLDARVAAARAALTKCNACPRCCGVDRMAGKVHVCRTGRWPRVASWGPHHGEERCLSGDTGSGTIFFSMCNLRCVFCQNADISQAPVGESMDAEALADVMLSLQAQGCHNINLVTPEHVAPQVVETLARAVRKGLELPVVYNTSGYDSLEMLRLLDGLVDIYLPDFKFWHPDTAKRLAHAADYPEHARAALTEMHRQVGPLRFGSDGLARRGVLVRHLAMPGLLDESRAIFHWLAENLSPDTYLHILEHYRPCHEVGGLERFGPAKGTPRFDMINRAVAPNELAATLAAAQEAGLWRLEPSAR